MNHYVYILECKDGSWYTGYTTDVDRRIKKHASGKGAKYTRGRGPFRLVATWAFPSKEEAMRWEYEVKHLSRWKKEQLVSLKGGPYENTTKLSTT
ncbi:GIY-YIG nuclease family protein [Halalkalibacterium halodurans]|uniref:GIY-YIG nuclease family protein n=1 Tax=Halalkalibacterium halodurans TaxID=86665 RepID=UPI002AA9B387|nr:GIY-YIG nuclease family protein [Halalkalibacterium halodurans]MDY7220550.1 GIY-YIG nuclease family protein [Halalkalibacterium halodurans]MDY7239789.1 GIY-YIG nuclease family protein [Halalkalibacterium halodurans]